MAQPGDVQWEKYKEKVIDNRVYAKELVQKVDEMLQNPQKEQLEWLFAQYEAPDFMEKAATVTPEIEYSILLMSVLKEECFRNPDLPLLSHTNTVTEFIQKWNRAKYLLWELEFSVEEDAEEQIFLYLTQNFCSASYIKYLVRSCAMFKKNTWSTLVCIFLDHGKVQEAKSILSAAVEEFPEDEALAQVQMQLNQTVDRR